MDNAAFAPDQFPNGHPNTMGDKRDMNHPPTQRLSPYFMDTPSHSSNSGGVHTPPGAVRKLYPVSPYYYHQAPDYSVTPKRMWHHNRYREDELPNRSSNMAAALYPRMQGGGGAQSVQDPNRRFSVASASSMTNIPHVQPRRISVSKFQDIPPGNYLKVPSFHNYDQHQNYYHIEDHAPRDYVEYSSQTTPPSHSKANNVSSPRKPSTSHVPKPKSGSHSSESRSAGQQMSRSQSQAKRDTNTPPRVRSRSPSMERATTPDHDALPVPAFEFTSSHLPLRPPTININRYSAGSGSTSTPESQRIESRQMIRTSASKSPYSPQEEGRKHSRKDTALGDIFSITKPAKWCNHAEGKTCKNCNITSDNMSQCSSINPPPTFTALDTYQPPRKNRSCSCSCGAIFSITIILGVLVMLFIAAFILYVELVLKHQTANVMDKM